MANITKTPEQLERQRAAVRKYKEKNREKLYANHKRYRDRNREKLNAIARERNKNNKEERRQSRAKFRRDNIDQCLIKEQEYRKKHRTILNDVTTKRRHDLRKKCHDHLGGSICYLCGFTSQWVCQFDLHHCKGEKLFSISHAISRSRQWDIIQPELDKCIILCRNCHALVGSSGTWKRPDFPSALREKIISILPPKSTYKHTIIEHLPASTKKYHLTPKQ